MVSGEAQFAENPIGSQAGRFGGSLVFVRRSVYGNALFQAVVVKTATRGTHREDDQESSVHVLQRTAIDEKDVL